jgi:hypothetical protein
MTLQDSDEKRLEAAVGEAKAERLKRRRQAERLYLVDPRAPPKLIDEGYFLFSRELRPPEAWPAAEQRMRDFGFEVEINGNVVAYKRWHNDRLVLADPRFADRIEFSVYADPSGRVLGHRQRRSFKFQFRDYWKRDALRRFNALLDAAVRRLLPLIRRRRT